MASEIIWYGLCGTRWGFDNDSSVLDSTQWTPPHPMWFKIIVGPPVELLCSSKHCGMWTIHYRLHINVAQFAVGVGIFETNVLPAVQALKFCNPKLQIHVHFVSSLLSSIQINSVAIMLAKSVVFINDDCNWLEDSFA